MQDLEALARELANEAGAVIRKYFRQPFDIESKKDDSPVTIADRGVEQRLREILEDRRPDDGILGEEFGTKESRSGLTWVIDPIDGTKSFIIGRPTFGTLIALWDGDTPLIGIIDQPVLKERWTGVKDDPTTFNGQAVTTRHCGTLKQACAASTTPVMLSAALMQALEKETKMMAWGGDCYMYGLLASGYMDLTVEALLSPYDFAALVPVVQGAGGRITDWEGQPLTLRSNGRVVAMGNPALWPAVEKILNA